MPISALPLVLSAAFCAGLGGPVLNPPETAGTLIKVVEDGPADQGAVPVGAPVVRRVFLLNVSGGDVRVHVVGTSCPCTTASLDTEKVPPGAKATLTLSTTAAEVPTHVTYLAEVDATSEGDSGQRQRVEVAIGYVPDIQVVASPRLMMLYATTRTPASADLVLRRIDGRPFELAEPTLHGDSTRVCSKTAAPGFTNQTLVKVGTRGKVPGTFRDRLDFHAASAGATASSVLLVGRVVEPFEADPPGIVWAGDPNESKLSKTLVLSQRKEDSGHDEPSSAHIDWGTSVPGDGRVLRVMLHGVKRGGAVGGAWILPIEISQGPEFFAGSHGQCKIVILNAEADTICTIPVVWFGSDALTKLSVTER